MTKSQNVATPQPVTLSIAFEIGVIRKMKILLTILNLAFLVGCSPDHTYKYYEFSDSSLELDLGTIKVGLRGKFVLVDSSNEMKITHKGNPYEFWVWFKTDSENIESINISDIEIISKSNEITKEHNGGTFPIEWSDYSKLYRGGWSFKGLYMEHLPLQISLKAAISTEKTRIEKTFTFELVPKYREEQANDFWSRLMSV